MSSYTTSMNLCGLSAPRLLHIQQPYAWFTHFQLFLSKLLWYDHFYLVNPFHSEWKSSFFYYFQTDLLPSSKHHSRSHYHFLSQTTSDTHLHPLHPACTVFPTCVVNCPLRQNVDPRYLNSSTFTIPTACSLLHPWGESFQFFTP